MFVTSTQKLLNQLIKLGILHWFFFTIRSANKCSAHLISDQRSLQKPTRLQKHRKRATDPVFNLKGLLIQTSPEDWKLCVETAIGSQLYICRFSVLFQLINYKSTYTVLFFNTSLIMVSFDNLSFPYTLKVIQIYYNYIQSYFLNIT